MAFESVYRVSTRYILPSATDVDTLARELNMDLPLGYREYVMTLGRGRLCDRLCTYLPKEISDRASFGRETGYELEGLVLFALSCQQYDFIKSALPPEDIEAAIVFAHAWAEKPKYIASRRFGPRLFVQDIGIDEIPSGFFGLVDICTHEPGEGYAFPFFEPQNGRRRCRVFAVRPDLGPDGFVEALGRRWGQHVLCEQIVADEVFPHYFVPAIEGHVRLLAGPDSDLPPGSFHVEAGYDIDSERDVTAFAETVCLPGGSRLDHLGEAW